MDQFITDIRITKETFNDTNGELFQSTLLTLLKNAFSVADKLLFLCEFMLKKNVIIELISVSLFEKCIDTIISPNGNRRQENLDVGSPSVQPYSQKYPTTVETPENSGTIVSAISEQTQQQNAQSQQTTWIDTNKPPTSIDSVNLYLNNNHLALGGKSSFHIKVNGAMLQDALIDVVSRRLMSIFCNVRFHQI